MKTSETDLNDFVHNGVRPTAIDGQQMAREILTLRKLALATLPLVEPVRAIIAAEHYPDGTKHDDPEYERRRSVTAALVRHACDLRAAATETGSKAE